MEIVAGALYLLGLFVTWQFADFLEEPASKKLLMACFWPIIAFASLAVVAASKLLNSALYK
jgi:hypothetical protein